METAQLMAQITHGSFVFTLVQGTFGTCAIAWARLPCGRIQNNLRLMTFNSAFQFWALAPRRTFSGKLPER
jgi:hypothetical protein